MPTYLGVEILGNDLDTLLAELQSKGLCLSWFLTPSILVEAGLAFTANDDNIVEAVAIFRTNYWDDERFQ